MTRFLSSLVALMLLGSSAIAQTPVSDLVIPPLPALVTPDVDRVVLDNGIVVFLHPDATLPLVHASLLVKVGSSHDPAGRSGLAQVFADAIVQGGSALHPGAAFSHRLDALGSELVVQAERTRTTATLTSLSESAAESITLFSELFSAPAFVEPVVVQTVRRNAARAERRATHPTALALDAFWPRIYASDSPYAQTASVASLSPISRDLLVRHHATWIHPANVILGVRGDFQTDSMLAVLNATLGQWKQSSEAPSLKVPLPLYADQPGTYVVSHPGLSQSTILMGHSGEIRANHPDYAAMLLMNAVLFDGWSGRLPRSLRSSGLVYGVEGAYAAHLDRTSLFYVEALTQTEQTQVVIDVLLQEIDSLRAAPPSQEEMDLTRDSYLRSFVFEIADGESVVERLMEYERVGLFADYLTRLKAAVEAVTASDIQRVAKRYLHPEKLVTVIVADPTRLPDSLTEFVSATSSSSAGANSAISGRR